MNFAVFNLEMYLQKPFTFIAYMYLLYIFLFWQISTQLAISKFSLQ